MEQLLYPDSETLYKILGFLSVEEFYSIPLDDRERAEEIYWSFGPMPKTKKEKYEMIKLGLRINSQELVKRFLDNKTKIDSDLFVDITFTNENANIIFLLLEKIDIDTLMSIISDIFFRDTVDHKLVNAIIQSVIKGNSKDRRKILDNALEYIDSAIELDNLHIFKFLWLGIPQNENIQLDILTKAVEKKAKELVLYILGERPIYFDKFILIKKEDSLDVEKKNENSRKITYLAELLKGTKYEDKLNLLLSKKQLYHDIIYGTTKFKNISELAINLHISPECKECSNEIFEAILDIIADKYQDKKVEIARKEITIENKEYEVANNDDAVSMSPIEEYSSICRISLVLTQTKTIYWFAAPSFGILKEKGQNPFTGIDLPESFLVELDRKIAYFNKFKVDYSKIQSISEIIGTLKGLLKSEEEFRTMKVYEQLSQILNAEYIPPSLYENWPDNPNSMREMIVYLKANFPDLPAKINQNKSIFYQEIIDYLNSNKSIKRERISVMNAVFAKLFKISGYYEPYNLNDYKDVIKKQEEDYALQETLQKLNAEYQRDIMKRKEEQLLRSSDRGGDRGDRKGKTREESENEELMKAIEMSKKVVQPLPTEKKSRPDWKKKKLWEILDTKQLSADLFRGHPVISIEQIKDEITGLVPRLKFQGSITRTDQIYEKVKEYLIDNPDDRDLIIRSFKNIFGR